MYQSLCFIHCVFQGLTINILHIFYCRHKDEIVSDVMELSTDVTSIVGEILLVLLQRFHLNIVPLLKPLHGLFYGLGLHVKFNCLDKDLMYDLKPISSQNSMF